MIVRGYDRAIADYTEVIERDANDIVAHNNRGLAHEYNGGLDHAIADYARVIELSPQDFFALHLRRDAH
jgi:tetratricopeptide (TPR) repeat protein